MTHALWKGFLGYAHPYTLNQSLGAVAIEGYKMGKPEAPLIAQVYEASYNVGGLLPQPVVEAGHYLYDYYFRIWVFPEALRLRNPRPLTDIPIHIWNAFPRPFEGNTLTNIGMVGADGITIDLNPPDTFKPVEYREVNLQVLPDAPIRVDASFFFDFEFADAVLGGGQFFLTVERASVVQMVPDAPILETWEFLTDIIVAKDGTEQRIALRVAPRRMLEFSLTVLDSSEWRTQFKRLFTDINSQLFMPYWQYHAPLTEDAPTGSTTILFNPALTDVREGEYILLVHRNGGNQLVKIVTLSETGCQVDTPLDRDFKKGDLLTPAMPSMFENRSSLEMYGLDIGKARFRTTSLEPRQVHTRPNSLHIPTLYEGLWVLDRRPLVPDTVDYVFDGGGEVIDSQTGVLEIKSFWKHTQLDGNRRFLINRVQNPAEMDWWRAFTEYCNGQQEVFYMPSYREDMVFAAQPLAGELTLTLAGSDYVDLYFPHEPWKRLAIETTSGMIYRTVDKAWVDDEGNSVLQFEDAWPDPAPVFTKIGFLTKCRLGSDTIRLEHRQLQSYIDITIRTVDD